MKKLSLIIFVMILIGNIYCFPDLEKYPNFEFEKLSLRYTNVDSIEYLYQQNSRIAKLYKSNKVSYFVISTDYSQPIGYNGITVLGITFNADLEIEEITIIASEDTRSFMRKLKTKRFLNQFIGYKKGDEIDIVTGATTSSKAVIKSVRETVGKIKSILEKNK